MKKLLIPCALSLLVAAPALAQPKTSFDQVTRDLAALSNRVDRLEQDNAQLKTENVALQAENDRLEATSEYLKDDATATRKQLAQDAPKVAKAERISRPRNGLRASAGRRTRATGTSSWIQKRRAPTRRASASAQDSR